MLLKAPVIGKYFSLVNTLIHEVGHALVAILTGGKVQKIKLMANAEGSAHYGSRFWLGSFLTNLAGYPAASATAFLFMYFIHQEKYMLILIILIAILVISLALWIRNFYGILWSITISAAFAALLKFDMPELTENILLFLTAILFVASITTAFTILKLSFKQPRDAGDATNLAKATFIIPPQIWGVLFFAQSLVFGYFGIMLYI